LMGAPRRGNTRRRERKCGRILDQMYVRTTYDGTTESDLRKSVRRLLCHTVVMVRPGGFSLILTREH
jgi:hypothetical protein